MRDREKEKERGRRNKHKKLSEMREEKLDRKTDRE
jgi:hypothetical protein